MYMYYPDGVSFRCADIAPSFIKYIHHPHVSKSSLTGAWLSVMHITVHEEYKWVLEACEYVREAYKWVREAYKWAREVFLQWVKVREAYLAVRE